MTRRPVAQAGFALFDVLVTVALLALILGSFGPLFYRLEKTDAAIGRIEAGENVETVRRFLQQQLEASQARLGSGAGQPVRFIGQPGRIVFSGVADGTRGPGGLYESELRLDADGRLVLLRRPLGWRRAGAEAPEVLLGNLSALRFSYAPCPGTDPPREVQQWSDAHHLPFMVRLGASFRPEDGRDWRDVLAFLPAAACPGRL